MAITVNAFLTFYTNLLHTTAKLTILGARERSTTDYAPPPPGSSVKTRAIEYLSGTKPFAMAEDDYDAMPEDKIPPLAARGIEWLQQTVPIRDDGERWASAIEGERAVMRKFSDLLSSPRMRWQDPSNDEAFRWYCTQSIIAHRLEKDPAGDGYRIPLAFLQRYETREGADTPGSDAFFDSDFRPTRIEGFRGQTVRPGDPRWEMAKFHFRSSAALCATLADHAVYAHLGTANTMVVATRQSLDVDHPIRRFLSPFQIKTIGIDELARVTLIGPGAMVHRLTGFTWKGLTDLYRDGEKLARMETVPELLARNGTAHLGAKYPWGEDALDVWTTIERFVRSYLDLYYDEHLRLRATGRPDEALETWKKDLLARFPWPPDRARPMKTREELADMLSVIVWVVTAWHQHIAIPSDIARTPEFFAYYLPAGATSLRDMWPSKEKTLLNMLLVALTMPRGPRLMQDFQQFMLDARARACVHAFQRELGDVGRRIRDRNTMRDFALETFDPEGIRISIST